MRHILCVDTESTWFEGPFFAKCARGIDHKYLAIKQI